MFLEMYGVIVFAVADEPSDMDESGTKFGSTTRQAYRTTLYEAVLVQGEKKDGADTVCRSHVAAFPRNPHFLQVIKIESCILFCNT